MRARVHVRAHAFVFVRACLAEAKWGVASTRNFFSCSAGESIGTSACADSENRCMRASQPPGAVDPADMAAQFDESRVEWGQLPPRVRDAVRQGVRDPMSAAYRRLTQEYYRRLAEEGRK